MDLVTLTGGREDLDLERDLQYSRKQTQISRIQTCSVYYFHHKETKLQQQQQQKKLEPNLYSNLAKTEDKDFLNRVGSFVNQLL